MRWGASSELSEALLARPSAPPVQVARNARTNSGLNTRSYPLLEFRQPPTRFMGFSLEVIKQNFFLTSSSNNPSG